MSVIRIGFGLDGNMEKYADRRVWFAWGASGLLLIGLHVVLALISPRFAYEYANASKPIIAQVALQMLAGGIYVLVVWRGRHTPDSKHLLIWIVAVGVLLRICTLPSTPMLEDDYYRYLWDGALVAHWKNPYGYAPDEISQEATALPPVFGELAMESGEVIERINHPQLRTIYPPTAQFAFALAHWIKPWSLTAWRFVLLGFDGLSLLLLAMILRTCAFPFVWLAIYWWNPLLVNQTLNTAHMDVVALPFVLGAVLLSIRRKPLWSVSLLALALGAKIWPVVILPFVLRPIFHDARKLISALILFAIIAGVLFLPIVIAGLDSGSGFTAYSQRWEMNDALFMLVLWGAEGILRIIGTTAVSAQSVTRVFAMLALVSWMLWLVRHRSTGPADFLEKATLMVAALFLFSPTQFPWYYIWVIPFLTLRPRLSLLLLTALLPLYYLRFYLAAHDNVRLFDYGIVWLEYAPVWFLMVREFRQRGRSRAC